jgi:hypothetical protein
MKYNRCSRTYFPVMADVGFITLAAASFFFPVTFKAGAMVLEDALSGAFAMELVTGTRTSEAGAGITTAALWPNH